MTLTSRLATWDDVPALMELMRAAIDELQKDFLDEAQIRASHVTMGIDTQLIDDGTYFVVECDGELAGCGGWSRRATLYGGDHSPGRDSALLDPEVDPARVRAMYTHPSFTRRGVGRLILALCESAAAAEGFTRLELMASLAGARLYSAAGFEAVEEVSDASGGVAVPLVRMGKRITSGRRAGPSLQGVTTFPLAGVQVPRIGLGTNRLTTAPEHVSFIQEAVAAGVGHIDTAHGYSRGDSERAIGEALAGAAEDLLVATKGGYQPGEGRPDVLAGQIEQSLRSLRTDAIGLYYLHRVDPETPLEDSLGAIKAYVDRGAIRNVGLSAVSVEQIERARQIVPIAAVQNHYNVAERGYDDVVDFCEREGIAFVAYYPLRGAGGSGVAAAAERLGVTENAVKLAWLLRRSPVMLPIPGTLSIQHLRENLAALELDLGDTDDIAA